jgi:hypothetical protein
MFKITAKEKALIIKSRVKRNKAMALLDKGDTRVGIDTAFTLKNDALGKHKWLESVLGGFRWIVIKRKVTPEVLFAPNTVEFDPDIHYPAIRSSYFETDIDVKPFVRLGSYPTFEMAKSFVFKKIKELNTNQNLGNYYRSFYTKQFGNKAIKSKDEV